MIPYVIFYHVNFRFVRVCVFERRKESVCICTPFYCAFCIMYLSALLVASDLLTPLVSFKLLTDTAGLSR